MPAPQSPPKILLVEDEPDVRRILCDELANVGYQVDCVSTKAEAEALLGGARYGAVVLDVRLPDGFALDLVGTLEARGARALLITGHPDAMQVMEARGLNYLAKPFRIRELIDALERTMALPIASSR
jgi:DNA-binding response OmpR family regulator